MVDQRLARSDPIIVERHQGLPFRIELDLGRRDVDARQSEVLAGNQVELFVNVVDLLAQLFELARGLITNPSEVLGVDLLLDRFLRSSVPL